MTSVSDGDPLGAVIADYLQAVERGEKPDRASVLSAHPGLAAELAAYFADLDQMERMAAPFRMADPGQTSGIDASAGPLPTVRYFGNYELLEEIARGGMGVVYRARQTSLNRVVALKMILAGELASPADVERFEQEAEAAANLDHPNILPIYEVGEHDGQQYFTMKLVEGGSLADRPGPCPPREAAEMVATVARAVHFAHQRGILHRDLKPANILLDRGDELSDCPDAQGQTGSSSPREVVPYVTDFGLAKRTGADCGLTRSGAVVGTPSYMPPEQARGEKGLTVAADVYALGAVLYERLTGRPPFREESSYATIKQVIEADPADPCELNPKADPDLAAVALTCLAKDPASRYVSAAELADDLDRWLAGEPTKARPPTATRLAIQWLRRNAAAVACVVAIGVMGGVLTGLLGCAVDVSRIDQRRSLRLLIEGESWFNPLGWAYRVQLEPAVRRTVIAAAVLLWATVGWLVRVGVRPRTPAAAFGAAAAVGLLAAWVTNLFQAPILAAESRAQLYKLYAEEPPTWRVKLGGGFRITQPDIDIDHLDLRTLERHIAPEKRDRSRLENAREYSRAHSDLMEANRYYRATVGVWASQFSSLVFLLTAALASGLSADHLARSGRSVWRQFGCYVEMYLSVLLVLPAAVGVAVMIVVASEPEKHINPPPIWPFAVLFAATLVASGTACAGVFRRWHPAIRLGSYLALAGIVVGCFWSVWR